MIATIRTISHGSSLVQYLIKEAKNAEIIFANGLNGEDPKQIWSEMKNDRCNCNIKNDTISVVISPTVEESKKYTREDWEKLAWDFLQKFDEKYNEKYIDGAIKKDKHGKPKLDENGKPERYKRKIYSNLCGSQILCVFHTDSNTPHLQMAINRVDRSGRINDDFKIGIRATKIANLIAAERNLEQSEDVGVRNRSNIENDIRDVLKDMPHFDWNDFKARLERKNSDYEIKLKQAKDGKVVGWTISMNKKQTIYKGSEIGRKYTAGNMQKTWQGIYFSAENVELRKQKAIEGQQRQERLKRRESVSNKPQTDTGPNISRPTGRPLRGGNTPSHGQNREWEVGGNRYNPDDPDNQIKKGGHSW